VTIVAFKLIKKSTPAKSNSKEFRNWGRNIHCEVDHIWEPKTKEDLIWIVKEAKKQNRKVRAVGDGHSWSPMWFRDKSVEAKNGWIVKSNHLNQKRFDPETKRIIVGPGVLIGELMKLELECGYCVPVQVVLQEVMIGGVIGTGCHGTGRDRHTVSDYVYSITLIKSDGTEQKITKKDGDLFDAVKSGFGCFGLMWEIEFSTVKQPVVSVTDFTVPVSDLYDRKNPAKLKNWIENYDYTEVFWFPLNTKNKLWVKTFKYSDKEPTDTPTLHQKFGLLAVPASHLFAFLENKIPNWVPEVSDAFLFGLDNQKDAIQHLSYAMHFQDYLEEYAPMLDTEVCIRINEDYSNVVEAFLGIIDKTENWRKQGRYPLNVCLECRFIANSSALLSPAYGPQGTHHCYIEIISYDRTDGFEEYMRECFIPWFTEQKWNAIPHLGKYWQRLNDPSKGFVIQDYIRTTMGERFNRFANERRKIDPEGMFLNEFLNHFFYPEDTKKSNKKGKQNNNNTTVTESHPHVTHIVKGLQEKFTRVKSNAGQPQPRSHS
jgi:L-gulonolactone oxidase